MKGKVLIVGIGNTFRGDDGAGPALIKNLKSKVQSLKSNVQSPEVKEQTGKSQSPKSANNVIASKPLTCHSFTSLEDRSDIECNKVEESQDRLCEAFQLFLIDAGEVPENFLGNMVELKPDTILFVDAADFGVQAGSIKLIDTENLSAGGFSTHSSSLSLVVDYLRRETNAEILLLGIQPENVRIGDGLSKPVQKAIQDILVMLEI